MTLVRLKIKRPPKSESPTKVRPFFPYPHLNRVQPGTDKTNNPKKAPAEAEARPVVSGSSLGGKGDGVFPMALLLFLRARSLQWHGVAHFLHDVFKDATELRRNRFP